MYRALEHIEGEVIQGAIEILRSKYGLFSHALIRDAMLIHSDIPQNAVMEAYRGALNTIKVNVAGKLSRLHDVVLKITDWNPLIISAKTNADQNGYTKDKDWTVFTTREKAAQGFATRPLYDHRMQNVATK